MEFQCFHPSSSQSAYSSENDPANISTHSQDIFQAQFADELYPYTNSIPLSGPQQLYSPGSTDNTDQKQYTTITHPDSSSPQHSRTAVLLMKKSEEQIRTELVGLYSTLQRADRYQKYREKQPVLTPAEVMERDAADKKERERRDAENLLQNQKDSTVWPDFLEYAFWKALVRWPPMGRRKYMLEGVLKGRNELIQDLIYRDTGIIRDRKQISSHLQVLKAHLKDYPLVLAYMGIMEESSQRLHESVGYQSPYSPHLHSPQHAPGTVCTAEDGYIVPSHTWPHPDGVYTGSTLDPGSYTRHSACESMASNSNFAPLLSLNSQASMQPDLDSDIPAYDGFAGEAANDVGLQTLSSLDHQRWIHQGVTIGQEGCPVSMTANTNVDGPAQVACYSTRPELQRSNPDMHLENVSGQYQTSLSDENHGRIPQNQAAFHDVYHEQAVQCEGLAESGVFGTLRDVNHFM